ncbi:MAG: hypothetical protein Q7R98_02515 [Candidatus Jorgensenbacteria bacterium]|nr:hypothetical protein [Candidatus Jorgensenbacteria bacterium]
MSQSYHKYLETIRERGKKSKVYCKYQETGLQLAEILEDRKHKALYIKLSKEHDEQKLLQLAKNIAEKRDVKNKGAYFMRILFDGSASSPQVGSKGSPQVKK